MGTVRRIWLALLALLAIVVAGSVGYVILGFGWLDALYQTVTTITTVGFREVRPLHTAGIVFTIILIVAGVGTALYTFGVVLEGLVEGHLRLYLERRRMDREIGRMSGHAIVCGWGRVGRSVGTYFAAMGTQVVVVDKNRDRLATVPPTMRWLAGDVTNDEILRAAGIMRARALIAAIDTDADNVFVTLSARALRPGLVIVARARNESSESKLLRAGATRVVNPQRIGGQRMGAAALQPNVVEFLEVVMHDVDLEFRLEEVQVAEGSRLTGRALRETGQGDGGALVLALRHPGRPFQTNPPPDTAVEAGAVLIAIGTQPQLAALREAAGQPPR
ncbi:MAG: potassium channel family protein [Gemmatimonadota bacterium]